MTQTIIICSLTFKHDLFFLSNTITKLNYGEGFPMIKPITWTHNTTQESWLLVCWNKASLSDCLFFLLGSCYETMHFWQYKTGNSTTGRILMMYLPSENHWDVSGLCKKILKWNNAMRGKARPFKSEPVSILLQSYQSWRISKPNNQHGLLQELLQDTVNGSSESKIPCISNKKEYRQWQLAQ